MVYSLCHVVGSCNKDGFNDPNSLKISLSVIIPTGWYYYCHFSSQ